MTRILSPASNKETGQRSDGPLAGFAAPAWLVSVLAHAGLLALLATLTWTVTQKAPEREFSVGIMVKKDTADGQLFESRDNTYQTRTDSAAENKFVPEATPTEVTQLLPQYPKVDISTIGLSGSMLPGTSDLLALPDNAAQGGMTVTTFIGVQAWGRKFVYVIDRSSSMSERDRLGVAKRDLLASLEKLQPESQFQVIFYNLRPEMVPVGGPAKRLVSATDANKTRTAQYIDSVIADGGTDHLPALKMALSLRPDVIFFLTDAQDMTARDVKEITGLNKDRAHIHTIEFGVGPDVGETNTLRELAGANGGSYRYVDVNRLSGVGGEGKP